MSTTSKERDVLRALAIFHYLVGGLSALLILIPLVIFASAMSIALAQEQVEPGVILLVSLFATLAAGLALFGLAYAAAMIWAGRSLWAQRHWTFCLVMAGVSCLWFPYGTVLGILSIVYLLQDGVREAFEPATESKE